MMMMMSLMMMRIVVVVVVEQYTAGLLYYSSINTAIGATVYILYSLRGFGYQTLSLQYRILQTVVERETIGARTRIDVTFTAMTNYYRTSFTETLSANNGIRADDDVASILSCDIIYCDDDTVCNAVTKKESAASDSGEMMPKCRHVVPYRAVSQ